MDTAAEASITLDEDQSAEYDRLELENKNVDTASRTPACV